MVGAEQQRPLHFDLCDVSPLGTDELWDGVRAWATFGDHPVWPVEEAHLHGNDAARRYIPPTRRFVLLLRRGR